MYSFQRSFLSGVFCRNVNWSDFAISFDNTIKLICLWWWYYWRIFDVGTARGALVRQAINAKEMTARLVHNKSALCYFRRDIITYFRFYKDLFWSDFHQGTSLHESIESPEFPTIPKLSISIFEKSKVLVSLESGDSVLS